MPGAVSKLYLNCLVCLPTTGFRSLGVVRSVETFFSGYKMFLPLIRQADEGKKDLVFIIPIKKLSRGVEMNVFGFRHMKLYSLFFLHLLLRTTRTRTYSFFWLPVKVTCIINEWYPQRKDKN